VRIPSAAKAAPSPEEKDQPKGTARASVTIAHRTAIGVNRLMVFSSKNLAGQPDKGDADADARQVAR
jgi:hypothetical protein